jgi:hypothetical protein
MTISIISQLEDAEFRLVDLVSRLSPGRARDECNALLPALRLAKARLLAANPDVLRKKMEKRTHQDARNQRLHDALRDASGGHVCASYRAKVMHMPGVVDTSDTRMHQLHHSLVDERGVKCDAVNLPPGGMPNADGESEGQGTRFDEDKATAARAAGLAKRTGRPVPRPAGPTRFYWETNGTRSGLDALERGLEVDRINKYRASQGMVPLQ